jgi:ubiquinone biosynthesis protein
MERIKGVKVSDAEALDATGIDRVAMAALVVRSIFHQILIDGFFHADPHPGNIWVDTENQKLVFLDLGLMGTLPENLRTELGNLMRAIAERNAEEIVRVVMSIGTPFKPVDEDSLLREVQLLLDKYLSSSLADVSFADVVQAMLTTVFKEGIRLPNQLVLGVKALVQAEAIARTLNPAIMLSEIAETVGEQVVAHRLSPEVLLAELMREGRMIQRLVQNLPRSANDILRQMQSSGLRVDASLRNYEGWQGRQVAATNRLTAGVILVGVILASAMFVGSPAFADHLILRVTAVGGFLVALLLALLLVALTLLEGWRWRG